MLLITNFSGFRLGAVAGGLDGLFTINTHKWLIDNLFDLSKRVIDKPDTGQAAAWGLINNLSADDFIGILIGKLSEAGVI